MVVWIFKYRLIKIINGDYMLKNDKKIIEEFELKARPVDKTNFIMQKEILSVLKNILKELKDLNKDHD